jgi:hypothetical protein
MLDASPLSIEDQVKLLVAALADDRDPPPILKLIIVGTNAMWLVTECDPDDPGRLYGLADVGQGFPELGYFSLAEIKDVCVRLGLSFERDADFLPDKPLSKYAEIARAAGRIVA